MNHSILNDISTVGSVAAQKIFYNVHGLYEVIKGNNGKASLHLRKNIELKEQEPLLIADNIVPYLAGLTNYAVICSHSQRHDEAEIVIEKIRTICNDITVDLTLPAKASFLIACYELELESHFTTALFGFIGDKAKEIDEFISDYQDHIPDFKRLMLYFEVAKLFFGAGYYKKSLAWIKKALLLGNIEILDYHLVYFKLIQLLAYYELNANDDLSYWVKSLYRDLLKSKRMYKAERYILDFLRFRLSKIKNEKQRISAYKDLHADLVRLSKDPYEKKFLEQINLVCWLQSKIEKRSMEEIIKEGIP